MGNLFVREDQLELVERVLSLNPDSQPLWGKMTVNEMLCHIADPIRDAMGLREAQSNMPEVVKPLMKMILLNKRPFRRNLPILRVYLQGRKGLGTRPVNFSYDKATLVNLLNKLCESDGNFPLRPHAGAGRLKREQHGYLLWKHTHHHLQQFGV